MGTWRETELIMLQRVRKSCTLIWQVKLNYNMVTGVCWEIRREEATFLVVRGGKNKMSVGN